MFCSSRCSTSVCWENCENFKDFPRIFLTYLDQLELPGVLERWILLSVFLQSMWGVQQINTEVAQGGAEEILFRAVLQQRTVETRTRDRLVNLNGFFVVLELCRVLCNLQHALIGGTCWLLALEIVSCLFVVLNGAMLQRRKIKIDGKFIDFSFFFTLFQVTELTKSFASPSYISAMLWWCLAAIEKRPMSV